MLLLYATNSHNNFCASICMPIENVLLLLLLLFRVVFVVVVVVVVYTGLLLVFCLCWLKGFWGCCGY